MSTRPQMAKLAQRTSSDSMGKHTRTSHENEESLGRSGESSDLETTNKAQHFSRLEIGDFLEFDPRPTFVVDKSTNFENAPVEPVFCNAAFRSNHQLVTTVIQSRSNSPSLPHPKTSSVEFRVWMNESSRLEQDKSLIPPTFTYAGYVWNAFSIRERWSIFSGTAQKNRRISGSVSSRGHSPSRLSVDASRDTPLVRANSAPILKNHPETRSTEIPVSTWLTPGTPDWTVPHPEGDLSPHIIFARSVDWAATPLGDMSTWSPEFREVANLLMRNPHPAALFWGDELTVMYNKAYAEGVAGHKHPGLMGTGFRGPFKELWDLVSEVFDDCVRTGKSVAMNEQMLPIHRHGFLEETFYTWSITPLYGGTSKILGLYNAPFETTRQTINERRMRTLLNLAEQVGPTKSVSAFWTRVLGALAANEFDFPFALLYSIVDEDGDDGSSTSSESSYGLKLCVLEGSLGVPEDHPAAPAKLDLKRSRGGFIPTFRDAMQTGEPKLLNILDGSLSESLIEGLQWRGFGDPCKLAIVSPIRPTTGENVLGFLVIGVNPRRPYDKDYEAFIRLLNRQLATSLASVTLYEDEIRRSTNLAEAAALERTRLNEELAVSKSRLQRIAEVSPVGMFSIDSQGLLLEANDRWFEMTGYSQNTAHNMSWLDLYSESSQSLTLEGWRRLVEDKLPWTEELQLKKPWFDPITGEEVAHWVLAAAQPEFNPDNSIKGVIGSITDITLQKRSARDAETRARLSEQLLLRTQEAEALQKQRLEEAEEMRRQQNNFIDITSHEMRNPLSAIVQCADSISSSMTEIYNTAHPLIDEGLASVIKSSIDAAETIQLCAQHQKSIVDDILTISKLDSNLLIISPAPVRPVKILQQALKMFMAEFNSNEIKMTTHIDESIEDLKVDWVLLDPSRLLQVLINLLTNAIKFTKSERKRCIDISISASRQPPTKGGSKFKFFPTKKACLDLTSAEDWGTGEILYLRFEVRDTGCGLTEGEKKNLFTRFSQASPRTHIQYGGSGLGLFISRQLTELQGGSIGVASEAGVGSTFAFYLKSRRVETPDSSVVESRLFSDMESKAQIAQEDVSFLADTTIALRRRSTLPSSQHASLADARDWHVLIVEDNLVNQKILAAQITKLGCTTYVANHGGEALEILRSTRHFKGRELDGKDLSVILMDLEMPVMDGLTCVRKIRELEADGSIRGRIPIIAVTANARAEQIVSAKDSGMDDVMTKPFRIKQLIPKVEALLQSIAPSA